MSDSLPQSAPAVAITGSGGYLGSRVAECYVARGWRVVRLTRDPRGARDAIAFRLGEPLPGESLRDVQVLVHCAYDFSVVRRHDVERVNVLGTKDLFAAASRAGVTRVVCVSSISAFDGCASEYGKAKLAIEAVARTSGALVVRPGLVFGNPSGAMFGRLVDQVARRKVVPLIGDGSQVQYLVHRDDIADMLVKAGAGELRQIGDRPVTVAHPRPWPMRELLHAIAHRIGRSAILVPTPWRAVWAALKVAELLRLPVQFRSDSVVSLMHQNPAPDFTLGAQMGIECRPFA